MTTKIAKITVAPAGVIEGYEHDRVRCGGAACRTWVTRDRACLVTVALAGPRHYGQVGAVEWYVCDPCVESGAYLAGNGVV